MERCRPYDKSSAKYKDITKSVATFICQDGLPLYTVEKDGFKHLLNVIDCRYKLPSRTHFADDVIPKLYSEVKERVMNELDHIEYYSATTDGWTSNTMTPFLSLTVHYISDEWELKTRNLQTAYLPDDHTGKNLCDMIESMLDNWELSKDQMVSVTTDNGANMKVAVRELGKPRLCCFGLVLNSAVNRALENASIANAIATCRRLVSSVTCSYKRKKLLDDAQNELGITAKSLSPDCKTRWGSKFKMISRVLLNEQAIRRAFGDRETEHLIPSVNKF
jgi:hypothetical protein